MYVAISKIIIIHAIPNQFKLEISTNSIVLHNFLYENRRSMRNWPFNDTRNTIDYS